MGLVWSGRRQNPWLRVVEFRNDTTRSDQRESLVGPVPNSTTRTRTGPDPTRLDKVRGLVGDPSSTKTGRARLVEFGHNYTYSVN